MFTGQGVSAARLAEMVAAMKVAITPESWQKHCFAAIASALFRESFKVCDFVGASPVGQPPLRRMHIMHSLDLL